MKMIGRFDSCIIEKASIIKPCDVRGLKLFATGNGSNGLHHLFRAHQSSYLVGSWRDPIYQRCYYQTLRPRYSRNLGLLLL